MEAAIGFEPMNKGFADLCLTTWLRRRIKGSLTQKSRSGAGKAERNFLFQKFSCTLFISAFLCGLCVEKA